MHAPCSKLIIAIESQSFILRRAGGLDFARSKRYDNKLSLCPTGKQALHFRAVDFFIKNFIMAVFPEQFWAKWGSVFLQRLGWTQRTVCGTGLCAILLSCTTPAEHSNPLDPDSPLHTTTGALRVQVTTFYPPYQALAGANLRLQPLGLTLQSDANGQLFFENLETGTYALEATKPGYHTLQTTFNITARETHTLAVRLDGLPIVTSASITSARLATRESASPRLFLEITAEVTDPDGANDVMHVRVKFPGRMNADTLFREIGLTRWQRTLSSDSLAPLNPHNLVGLPLEITAEDGAGENAAPFTLQLARILDDEPLPVYPINGEIPLNPSDITLRWQLPAIIFDHTFRVEIVRLDAGFPALIFTARNIRSGTNSLPYPGRLSSGNYYWTVRVLDSFGNSSRSKEATFQVQ